MKDATHEGGEKREYTSAGNLGPDNQVRRLEDHVNEFYGQAILGLQAISLGGAGGTVSTSKLCLLNESHRAHSLVEGTPDGKIRLSRWVLHVERLCLLLSEWCSSAPQRKW